MKSKVKEAEPEEEDLTCKWNVAHEYREIRIIADCKACGGEGNLNESNCMRGILDAVSSESNADVVILSHYIETQYFGYSLELLKRMAQVMKELSQMTMRDPYNEYFQKNDDLTTSQKNQQKSTCEKCKRNPQELFPELKKIFTTDIHEFYKHLFKSAKKLSKGPTSYCKPCLKTTESDFVYMFNKLEDLRAFIFYRGYNIVI
jgi:dimeric dUTPase (all-alpha-NTP-PPase superfamily)